MRTQIDNAGVRPSGLRRRPSPPRITWLLLVSDLVALLATGPRSLGWLIGVALFPILAGSAGYYRSRLNLLLLDDLPGLLGRLFAASAIGAMAQQALRSEIDSNWWSHLVLGAILVVGFRAIVYASVRLARVRRLVNHPTLIVGLGDTGLRLANALVERTEYGLRPVGFFDSDPKHTSDLPVFGEPTNLADAIAATGANVVILAFSSLPETELVKAVRVCERLDAEIFYVPRLFDLHSLNAHDVEEIWAVPLRAAPAQHLPQPALGRQTPARHPRRRGLAPRPQPAAAPHRCTREVGTGITHPVSPGTGESRPSPLHHPQVPLAAGGEQRPHRYRLGCGPSPPGPHRRLPPGHFARRVATIVERAGRRHEPRRSAPRARPLRPTVHRTLRHLPRSPSRPAGLTGLAQIHGLRGDTSIDDRSRFDNAYVERWSLWNDTKILLRTGVAMVRWRGR
ncbi:MAG: sugar transferase [Acidimicrobiales bacterium]